MMCLCDIIFHASTYLVTMYIKDRVATEYFRHAWSGFFRNGIPVERLMFSFNEHPPIPDEILSDFTQENVT